MKKNHKSSQDSLMTEYTKIIGNRLKSAFPNVLSDEVMETISIIPYFHSLPTNSDAAPVNISGEVIHIPYRIYNPEPNIIAFLKLRRVSKLILACLYTRNHDGYIRLKYLRDLIHHDEIWVAPYVLQLTGEYVIEIINFIEKNINYLPITTYEKFISENPIFIKLLKQRIISYWNCNYRTEFPDFSNYPGFKVAEKLGLWTRKDRKHLAAPDYD